MMFSRLMTKGLSLGCIAGGLLIFSAVSAQTTLSNVPEVGASINQGQASTTQFSDVFQGIDQSMQGQQKAILTLVKAITTVQSNLNTNITNTNGLLKTISDNAKQAGVTLYPVDSAYQDQSQMINQDMQSNEFSSELHSLYGHPYQFSYQGGPSANPNQIELLRLRSQLQNSATAAEKTAINKKITFLNDYIKQENQLNSDKTLLQYYTAHKSILSQAFLPHALSQGNIYATLGSISSIDNLAKAIVDNPTQMASALSLNQLSLSVAKQLVQSDQKRLAPSVQVVQRNNNLLVALQKVQTDKASYQAINDTAGINAMNTLRSKLIQDYNNGNTIALSWEEGGISNFSSSGEPVFAAMNDGTLALTMYGRQMLLSLATNASALFLKAQQVLGLSHSDQNNGETRAIAACMVRISNPQACAPNDKTLPTKADIENAKQYMLAAGNQLKLIEAELQRIPGGQQGFGWYGEGKSTKNALFMQMLKKDAPSLYDEFDNFSSNSETAKQSLPEIMKNLSGFDLVNNSALKRGLSNHGMSLIAPISAQSINQATSNLLTGNHQSAKTQYETALNHLQLAISNNLKSIESKLAPLYKGDSPNYTGLTTVSNIDYYQKLKNYYTAQSSVISKIIAENEASNNANIDSFETNNVSIGKSGLLSSNNKTFEGSVSLADLVGATNAIQNSASNPTAQQALNSVAFGLSNNLEEGAKSTLASDLSTIQANQNFIDQFQKTQTAISFYKATGGQLGESTLHALLVRYWNAYYSSHPDELKSIDRQLNAIANPTTGRYTKDQYTLSYVKYVSALFERAKQSLGIPSTLSTSAAHTMMLCYVNDGKNCNTSDKSINPSPDQISNARQYLLAAGQVWNTANSIISSYYLGYNDTNGKVVSNFFPVLQKQSQALYNQFATFSTNASVANNAIPNLLKKVNGYKPSQRQHFFTVDNVSKFGFLTPALVNAQIALLGNHDASDSSVLQTTNDFVHHFTYINTPRNVQEKSTVTNALNQAQASEESQIAALNAKIATLDKEINASGFTIDGKPLTASTSLTQLQSFEATTNQMKLASSKTVSADLAELKATQQTLAADQARVTTYDKFKQIAGNYVLPADMDTLTLLTYYDLVQSTRIMAFAKTDDAADAADSASADGNAAAESFDDATQGADMTAVQASDDLEAASQADIALSNINTAESSSANMAEANQSLAELGDTVGDAAPEYSQVDTLVAGRQAAIQEQQAQLAAEQAQEAAEETQEAAQASSASSEGGGLFGDIADVLTDTVDPASSGSDAVAKSVADTADVVSSDFAQFGDSAKSSYKDGSLDGEGLSAGDEAAVALAE